MVKPTHREYIFLDNGKKIKTCGYLVTIIDYTLSRIRINEENSRIIYRNLGNDSWLFDHEQNRVGQYAVYDQMEKRANGNWGNFFPENNADWTLYIANYMLKKYQPKCSCIANFISRSYSHLDITRIYEKENFVCESNTGKC